MRRACAVAALLVPLWLSAPPAAAVVSPAPVVAAPVAAPVVAAASPYKSARLAANKALSQVKPSWVFAAAAVFVVLALVAKSRGYPGRAAFCGALGVLCLVSAMVLMMMQGFFQSSRQERATAGTVAKPPR